MLVRWYTEDLVQLFQSLALCLADKEKNEDPEDSIAQLFVR